MDPPRAPDAHEVRALDAEASRVACAEQAALARADLAQTSAFMRYAMFPMPTPCEAPLAASASPPIPTDPVPVLCREAGLWELAAPSPWRLDAPPAPAGKAARFLEAARPRGCGAFF